MPVENYMLNLPNPTESVLQAMQLRQGMQQQQAQAQELRYNEQMQADLATLAEDPTPGAVARMMVRYPQLSEQFERGYNALSAEQQQATLNETSSIYAALLNEDTDLAERMLTEKADALRNSGQEGRANVIDDLTELLRVSPESARTSIGLQLAATMGADDFTETFTALQRERAQARLDPSELTEAQARAQTAAVEARFAESKAVSDLERQGWDILKLQNDIGISNQNAEIAQQRLALEAETNDLRRQELEQQIAEAEAARDETVRARAAELESARANIDNMLSTADRILNIPMRDLRDAAGAYDTSFVGRAMDMFDQDVANTRALFENFDAQAFLSQIPLLKGLGALSDAEGKKITAALQNFSLTQSPDQLLQNVTEAQRLLLKARQNLANEYGVPDSVPDTPFAEPTPEEIDQILQQYLGGQ